jgi:hypothetical protein
MLYTCYDYNVRYNKFCLIFIRDKDIINISVSYYYDDEECWLFLVMTENMMKKYPVLYKKYMISIMLTEDATRLFETENGVYHIRKRTICENLYITEDYNSKNTYMFRYPVMSYELSSDTNIRSSMHIIEDCRMINYKLLLELFENEAKKIEEELKEYEDYTNNNMMYFQYINKIMPENFPDDLKNNILAKICLF